MQVIEQDHFRETAGEIVREIGKALKVLAEFLVIAFLTLILMAVRLLPLLLRVVSVMVWAVSMYQAFVSVYALYVRFSDPIASLIDALIAVLVVALLPSICNLEFGDQMWGGYALAALVGFGIQQLAQYVAEMPGLYAFAGTVPPIVASAIIMMFTFSRR